jgi:beta-1,4-mannosyl-glycoprotein beta-1,4-N-acetylglucosaminyltransferase
MLIDVFPFSDEVDLAEIRLNYLSEYVDFFVVTEFDVGFSGIEKDFYFPRVIEKLPKSIQSKILYYPQHQRSLFESTFENDRLQKDSLARFVVQAFPKDCKMIFGDLDEFPNMSQLPKILEMGQKTRFCHLAQFNFMGFLNVIEYTGCIQSYAGEFSGVRQKKWLGTVVTEVENLKQFTMTELRNPERKSDSLRVNNGGWHFSFCGGEGVSFQQRFEFKVNLTAHQEFNTQDIKNKADDLIKSGLDPLNRHFLKRIGPFSYYKRPKFKILDGLGHLPDSLVRFCTKENLVFRTS